MKDAQRKRALTTLPMSAHGARSTFTIASRSKWGVSGDPTPPEAAQAPPLLAGGSDPELRRASDPSATEGCGGLPVEVTAERTAVTAPRGGVAGGAPPGAKAGARECAEPPSALARRTPGGGVLEAHSPEKDRNGLLRLVVAAAPWLSDLCIGAGRAGLPNPASSCPSSAAAAAAGVVPAELGTGASESAGPDGWWRRPPPPLLSAGGSVPGVPPAPEDTGRVSGVPNG